MTYASRLHWCPGSRGIVLHIRDTAKYFDPFALGDRPCPARKAVLIWMPMGVRLSRVKQRISFTGVTAVLILWW